MKDNYPTAATGPHGEDPGVGSAPTQAGINPNISGRPGPMTPRVSLEHQAPQSNLPEIVTHEQIRQRGDNPGGGNG